jgi:hypothetical protein
VDRKGCIGGSGVRCGVILDPKTKKPTQRFFKTNAELEVWLRASECDEASKARCEACPHFDKVAKGESPIGLGYPTPEQQAAEEEATAAAELESARGALEDLLERTLEDRDAPFKKEPLKNLVTLNLGDRDACLNMLGELEKLKDSKGSLLSARRSKLGHAIEAACKAHCKQQKTNRKKSPPLGDKPLVLVEAWNPEKPPPH